MRTTPAVGLALAGLTALGTLVLPSSEPSPSSSSFTARVTLRTAAAGAQLDGRAYLLVAKASDLDGDEPRDHSDVVDGIPIFGKDVTGLSTGGSVRLTTKADTYGYPYASLAELPKGRYVVQAFFNRYETAHRSDGSTVSVHFPCGDGGDLWHSPGNVYSTPRTLTIDPRFNGSIDLALDQVVTPAEPVPAGGTCQQGNSVDSAHVKHIKIQSPALTAFWGRPMYVAADVLLPQGYDDPANAGVRYPMEVNEGHYPGIAPHGFREAGTNAFSTFWLAAGSPRFISVTFRSENPFYDDSYGVDSANLGPYGTALNEELLPLLDDRFRSIGAGWGRVLTGGSTGGWISLATQILHPDLYGGVWSGYPDSLDFHAHQLLDLYGDDNAYYNDTSWVRNERPAAREVSGDTIWTVGQENHWELALGTHGRSMGQWDVWNAVYGPQGADGYPAAPWDKRTGAIDHAVTAAWKPFDLTDYVTNHWDELAPSLTGKLHVYVGDADTYFLNDGVNLFDKAVSALQPAADAQFQYGRNAPHGYSPYTTPELFGVMAAHVVAHAPAGTDTSGWAPRP